MLLNIVTIMWNFIKIIIGCFIVYLLYLNFDKAVAIGNMLFDKAYKCVVSPAAEKKVDLINKNLTQFP